MNAGGRTGAQDTVFLNAQNWQTTKTIAGPLRALGIPAAVVLDLDVLLRDQWAALFQVAGIEEPIRTSLAQERQACAAVLEAMGTLGDGANAVKRCKVEGLDGLLPADRIRLESFLDALASYGLFLVPVGELEKWLVQFGLTNKQTWVTDMLARLGVAGGPAYVEPGAGDVWGFVEKIATWIENPMRLGIPS